MKPLQQLFSELGIAPVQKTASVNKEDAVIDLLKKLAAGEDAVSTGSQQVSTNFVDDAAKKDPSQVLDAATGRENKATPTDQSSLTSSTISAMTQGTTSHKLNEVPLQGPAQANTKATENLEVVASKVAALLAGRQQQSNSAVDLDQVFKVAYINDFLGRQAAQAAYMNKMAQEGGMMPPTQDPGAAQAGAPASDPTEEILALLGQTSAEDLASKKDQLLAAIADVLESNGEGAGHEAAEAPAQEKAEEEAKTAASKLLSLIQNNPGMRNKVAAMFGK